MSLAGFLAGGVAGAMFGAVAGYIGYRFKSIYDKRKIESNIEEKIAKQKLVLNKEEIPFSSLNGFKKEEGSPFNDAIVEEKPPVKVEKKIEKPIAKKEKKVVKKKRGAKKKK